MNCPQRAVCFLEEDSSIPAHSKPLMLEAVLFCPILKWMSDKLLADGVQRFFAVSSPRFAQEVRACFPEDADVTISEQHSELLDFLNTPDPVAVFVRAALPMEEAGPGFVYGAAGYELQAVWQEKMTNAVSAAELIPGWVPVFSLETVAELEPLLRERIVRRHIRAGVRVLDPNAVYIDPRVTIGRGTMLLPGTILRGETAVGCGCTIGPNAVVRDCVIGDETEINASQVNESTIGSRTHVGPFAYVRPGCAIGDDIKVGDFGISRVLQFTQDMAQTAVGTPLYVAPEVVKGVSYDAKADVWSMGCTFYEIITLTPPFTAFSLSDLIGKVKRGQYTRLSSSVE